MKKILSLLVICLLFVNCSPDRDDNNINISTRIIIVDVDDLSTYKMAVTTTQSDAENGWVEYPNGGKDGFDISTETLASGEVIIQIQSNIETEQMTDVLYFENTFASGVYVKVYKEKQYFKHMIFPGEDVYPTFEIKSVAFSY